MKNGETIELFKALHNVMNLRGSKFAYCVNKNISMLKPEIESIDKGILAIEDYVKYNENRAELAKNSAKKDTKGEPMKEMRDDQEIYVLENKEKFEKEVRELQETHKGGIEEYQKFLKEENAHVFHKVKIDDVPAEITAAQMQSIFPIIAE